MINVLYIVSSLAKTGPTNQVYSLISNIDRNKINPILLKLSNSEKKSRENDFLNLGVEIFKIDKKSKIGALISACVILKKIIKKRNIAIVHSHCFRPDLINYLSFHKKYKISTIHNMSKIDYSMTYGNKIGLLMYFVHRFVSKKINMNCCVSKSVEIYVNKNYKIKNICTINNTVDTSKFKTISFKEKNILKNNMGFENYNNIWITPIGKDTRKNSFFVAKVVKKYLKKFPHDLFIFVGDGEQKNKCENLLREYNCIFTGYTNKINKYLQLSNYYISASKAEGLPTGVLEAMSCCSVCFLSNIPPHKEIVEKNDASYIFNSEEELLELMLLHNKIDEKKYYIPCKAVKSYYSEEKMCKDYLSLYSEVGLN